MKNFTTVLLLACYFMGSAQNDHWQRIIKEKVPADLPMSSSLYQLARLNDFGEKDLALRKAEEYGFPLRSDGSIYVEAVMHDREYRLTANEARKLGIEPELIWRNIVASYIHIDYLIPIARTLKGSGYLQFVTTHGEDFQGQAAQNATGYVNAGKDGSGITIGLIDKNYGQWTLAKDSSQIPINVDTIALPAGNAVVISGANAHGTGCLEAIYDNAPGADYVVGRFQGDAAFGALVDSMVAMGVNIISTSSAGYNQGWNDDTGNWSQAVTDACNAGVLFLNSAGNAARQHWEGAFNNDGNGTHIWSGSDTANTLTLDPNNNAASSNPGVNVHLQWASANPGNEYDLFLYNMTGDTLLGSSMGATGFETINFTNTLTTQSRNVHIVVRSNVSNPPMFEVFAATQTLTYQVAAGSTRAPSDCTHPNALSVGAVDWADYDTIPGATVIKGYSSNGPTNSGNQAPDLCGPTDTFSVSNPPSFGGTSCATPNAAGAAAVLWSALPDYSADGIRMLLLRKAELYNDWGPSGTDMTYGRGGLYLNACASMSEYIMLGSGNTTGASEIPYSSIEQADQFAPINSNVFFLGGTYNAPSPGAILDNPKTYRSVVEDARVE